MRSSPADADRAGPAWPRSDRKALRSAAIWSAAFFVLAATTGAAFATRYSITFHGTRAQVRSACAKVGGMTEEGANYTACSNPTSGNTVTCDNKGVCTGGYTAITVNKNPSWRPSSVTEALQH